MSFIKKIGRLLRLKRLPSVFTKTSSFYFFGFAELEAADKMNFNLQKIDCQNEIKELVKKIPVEGYFPGCTPNDYNLTVKCKKGADLLLTTDKTVEEISALTGFSSASHFRRVLKSKVGMTPKEMQKNSSF